MRRGVVLLMAVGWLQAGCYNYTPVRRSGLVPSMYVAITLTQDGSEQLAPYLGPSVVVVRGRFLSATERGLVVSALAVETRRGDNLEWKGESVLIPTAFVRSLEERHAAKGKTAMLAGASLFCFFASYAAFGSGAQATTLGGGGSGASPQ